MANCASFVGNSALIHSTVTSESNITQNASPRMRKKWKLHSQFNVRKRKLVESALTSFGRRTDVSSALESCRTAIIASVWSAFERGGRQSSLIIKLYAPVLNAVLALTLFVQAASGSTTLKRRNSLSRNTNQHSAKRTVNTLRR